MDQGKFLNKEISCHVWHFETPGIHRANFDYVSESLSTEAKVFFHRNASGKQSGVSSVQIFWGHVCVKNRSDV